MTPIILPPRIKSSRIKEQIICGDHARVPLTRGYFAVIDIADLPLVSGRNWAATQDRYGTVYAKTSVTLPDGSRKIIIMHRMICGVADQTVEVDHRDGDGLNNRRNNLRPCSRKQNGWNRGLDSNNTTGFKGVTFKPEYNSYEAKIRFHYQRFCLGSFKTASEAASAYDDAAVCAFGEYATLNFPRPGFARAIHSEAPRETMVNIRFTDYGAAADHFKDNQLVKAMTRILAQRLTHEGIGVPGVIIEERTVS